MAAPERIILGSGYVHIGTFTKGQIIPNPEEFCQDSNKFAYISGGAELSYSSDFYEAKDDMGKVSKSRMTQEEATLKSGIMTFCGNTIEKLCETARVSSKTVENKDYTVVKIGGIGNANGKRYVICFHHDDKEDGDIWVMIVGNNQAGFSMAFAKDKETVVDAEFKAMPNDEDGTLIIYEEEVIGD